MNSFMKKALVVLLCVGLLGFAFAACGNQPAAPTPTPAEAAPTTDATPAETTPEPTINFPTSTIEVIVPWGAGGSLDTMGRGVQRHFNLNGRTIVVTNITGASGAVGTMEGVHANPDGYRLLLTGIQSILSYSMAGSYDMTIDDLIPIATLGFDQRVIAVHNDSPFQTFEDVVEWAMENPGELTWGGSGARGFNEMLSRKIWDSIGIEANWIPFEGGAAARTAGLGGHIDVTFLSSCELLGVVNGGEMRALALSMPERSAHYPDTPTLAELGHDFSGALWATFFAPLNTPLEIVDMLEAELRRVFENPEFYEAIFGMGFEMLFMDREETLEYIARERVLMADLFELMTGERPTRG